MIVFVGASVRLLKFATINCKSKHQYIVSCIIDLIQIESIIDDPLPYLRLYFTADLLFCPFVELIWTKFRATSIIVVKFLLPDKKIYKCIYLGIKQYKSLQCRRDILVAHKYTKTRGTQRPKYDYILVTPQRLPKKT